MTEINFIPVGELEWVTTKIIKEHADGPPEGHPWLYELELYKPLAEWDVWSYWEKERIASMQKHIGKTDILFEIGAETGWMAALFSKYITENIVLIEPTEEFWPNIKALFERNNLKEPLASYCGFFNDQTTGKPTFKPGWPTQTSGDVIEKLKYRNVHDQNDMNVVESITLDSYVQLSKIVPDAMSIDAEGSELLILKGAEKTLKKYHPHVWCSVHPDLLERDYGVTKEDVLFFMKECGYKMELLAIDHEHHYHFWVS